MVVRLTAPRRHWVVLGSFIPRLYSGTPISLLFGLNNFLLNLTLGSRDHFHPESTLLPMIVCCTRSFRRCYSMFYQDTCAHRLCKFTTTETSLWIATYSCHPYLHSRLLLLVQDTLNYFPLFRESFVPTALQFLPHEYPLRIIPRTYRLTALPLLFIWFTRHIEILSDLLIIVCPLLLGKYLSACIMVAFHMTSNIH